MGDLPDPDGILKQTDSRFTVWPQTVPKKKKRKAQEVKVFGETTGFLGHRLGPTPQTALAFRFEGLLLTSRWWWWWGGGSTLAAAEGAGPPGEGIIRLCSLVSYLGLLSYTAKEK